MRKATDPMGHELRVELADLLTDHELTGAEVCGYLPGAPTLETVGYHLRVLESAGLVERVGGLWRRTV